jgi:flagellar biosynthesis/type III secretory pathway M-ring protein FliF/YscJ
MVDDGKGNEFDVWELWYTMARVDIAEAKREYREMVRREQRHRQRLIDAAAFVVVALAFPFILAYHILKPRRNKHDTQHDPVPESTGPGVEYGIPHAPARRPDAHTRADQG